MAIMSMSFQDFPLERIIRWIIIVAAICFALLLLFNYLSGNLLQSFQLGSWLNITWSRGAALTKRYDA